MAIEAFDADPAGLPMLLEAVERPHDCRASLRNLVPVKEKHGGEVVWSGMVTVFDLEGHRSAETAYAWSDPIPGSDHRRLYAVLHAGPVDSPEKAVRAAIVRQYREAKGDA